MATINSEPSLTLFQPSTSTFSTNGTSLTTPTPTIVLGGPGPIPAPSLATASTFTPGQDTTLCNIAFSGALRYDFVLENEEAVTDIFYYTPKAIAYALNLPDTMSITMAVLQPCDAACDLVGFEVTLALFYIPSSLVEPLGQQIVQNNSHFHSNSSDPNLNAFIGLINPNQPLTGINAFPIESGQSTLVAAKSTISQMATLITSQTAISAASQPSSILSPTTNSGPSNINPGPPSTTSTSPSLAVSSGPSSAIKGGIGGASALGAIVLLTLIIFLVVRCRKKARTRHLPARDAVQQQMLETDGQPRSELNGKEQPIEKDSVVRNELYYNVPAWEPPENGDQISDYRLDNNASLISRNHTGHNALDV